MPDEWTGKALEACLGSGIHSCKEQMVCGFFEDPDIRCLQSRQAGPEAPVSCVFLLSKMEGHTTKVESKTFKLHSGMTPTALAETPGLQGAGPVTWELT